MRVAVFAGPSGGHLFPAKAFAEELKKKFPESTLHLITSHKATRFTQDFSPTPFEKIEFFPSFPWPSAKFFFEFPRAFLMAYQYLKKNKPALCVGFGSYVSYPGMRLAALFKIPTLIHEQNVLPGKATQMLASVVNCVAVSFDATFQASQLPWRECLGLPLRSSLYEAEQGRKSEKGSAPFTILVQGGSQGASRLNQLVLDALERLTPEEKSGIVVNHITGERDHAWVSDKYQQLGIQYEAYPFYANIGALYGKADMAITRAGANTLWELALFKLPAIVIPYPHAAGHQKANAQFFDSHEAAIAKEEETMSADWLMKQILKWKNQPIDLARFSQRLSELSQAHASDRLVSVAEKLIKIEVAK